MRSSTRIARLVPFLALLGASVLPQPVGAQVAQTARALLASHFVRSERVSFVRVRPDPERRAAIERALGARLAREEYVVYRALRAGSVDGFAIFDAERGEHQPIDIATFLDASARITRVEILVYREAYGDAVRGQRFLRQLVGRDARSGFSVGRDIDAISGATISARSVARASHRAALLVELARESE